MFLALLVLQLYLPFSSIFHPTWIFILLGSNIAGIFPFQDPFQDPYIAILYPFPDPNIHLFSVPEF